MTRAVDVGDSIERTLAITEDLVQSFADLVGDHNPLHVDAVAAAAGLFGRPVVHGMLSASLFSGIIAHDLPGPGSIYLSQSIKFLAPIFVNSTIVVRLECTHVDLKRRHATLRTVITNQDGVACLDGEAVIRLP